MRSIEGRGPARFWVVPLAVLALYFFWAVRPSYVNPYYQNSYNRVVDAWLAGRLDLAANLDPAFLKDPYNFAGHVQSILAGGIIDLSLYEGKLYSYFGAAPAAILYLPYRLASLGHRLPDKAAVFLFCSGGFLAACALLLFVRRRYFFRAPDWAVHASLAVLGVANLAPMLIRLSNVYEVAMSAAFFFFTTALYALVSAFRENGVSARRLFLAGLCAGLAVASRPNFALAAAACLPLVAWKLFRRRDGRAFGALAAFVLPLAVCAAALAAYNRARFGDPFEFGARYQITPLNPMGMGVLLDSSRSLLSGYLLLFQPPLVDGRPPFLHPGGYPFALFRWPAGTYQIDTGALGLVPAIPFVLIFFFGPMVLWASRASGAADYFGPKSPFRAALRDAFLIYLGLFLLDRFLLPFRNAPSASEAALFAGRCADELPPALVFAAALSARFFASFRAADPASGQPAPRFEAALLGAAFLALFSVAVRHQNVNLRYPADFASLAILASATLWFYCDSRLKASRGGFGFRVLLGTMTFFLAAFSVAIGLLRSMSV